MKTGRHEYPGQSALAAKLVLIVNSVLPNGGAELTGRVVHLKFNRIGPEMRKYDSNSQKNSEDSSEGWELFADAKFNANIVRAGLNYRF